MADGLGEKSIARSSAEASPERPSASGEAAADATLSPAPKGNTGIQTSIYPPMGLVGVDSLVVTVEGEKKENFDGWSSRIAAAVELRRRGDDLPYIQMLGASLFPRGRGFSCGVAWLDHVLDGEGVVYGLRANWPTHLVSVGDRLEKQDLPLVGQGRIAAKVEIGSTPLLRFGVQGAWQQALRVLEELGIAVVDSCVSRIDVRADLINVPVVEFAHALSERRFVTRFKKGYSLIPSDPEETETCYLGRRGYLTLRIYDKLAQLRQLPEVEGNVKWELLMGEVVGSAPVDSLTRVEWEMCREFLSQFNNCRSVEGVLANLPLILDRLNFDTFRLTVEPNRGDGNQSELTLSPLWDRVTQMFTGYTGDPVGKLDRPMKRPVETSRVMKQLLHRATSIAAVQAVAIETRHDLLRVLVPLLQMEIDESHVTAVHQKRLKLVKSGLSHTLGLDEFIQPPDVPF